jgi:hypothetical protein
MRKNWDSFRGIVSFILKNGKNPHNSRKRSIFFVSHLGTQLSLRALNRITFN